MSDELFGVLEDIKYEIKRSNDLKELFILIYHSIHDKNSKYTFDDDNIDQWFKDTR